MNIYILRHAIAVPGGTPGYPNDDRPLTDEGIDKMKKNAKGIAEVADDIDVIVSSPLIRAHDTAKMTAKALKYKDELVITEHLAPEGRIEALYGFLEQYDGKNIMLVGHEPYLGYLASDLIGINKSVIEFKKGGICLIEIEKLPPEVPGTLKWNLAPKQLRLIAGK